MKESGEFDRDRWVENHIKWDGAVCGVACLLNNNFKIPTHRVYCIRLRFNWPKNLLHSSSCARDKVSTTFTFRDRHRDGERRRVREICRIQFYRIRDGKVNKTQITRRSIVVTP